MVNDEIQKSSEEPKPLHVKFAMEVPKGLQLERNPLAGDTTTWDYEEQRYHTDDD